MIRYFTPIPVALFAAPALAHEGAGVFHLHPHGSEVLLVGLALGAILGGARIVQGRHYLSDVVFSFWVVYGTALALAALVYRARGGPCESSDLGESPGAGASDDARHPAASVHANSV